MTRYYLMTDADGALDGALTRNADTAAKWRKQGVRVLTLVEESPTPPRVLREVKGVTYRDERFHYCERRYVRVVDLMAHFPSTFTDADHAKICALKDDPYQPVETVEAIVRGMSIDDVHEPHLSLICARLRAAVAAERGGAE